QNRRPWHPPNGRFITVVDQESLVRYNQFVESYNHTNSEEIKEINQQLIDYWEKLNDQRENLPTNKRKWLAKLTVEGEEITIFTELKELVLLNSNDEAEKIIQQADQKNRQIEINQLLYEKKCQLIWLISQLLGEEKPTVLEKEKTGNEEELSPPQLDEAIFFNV
ncbi:17957_t:CDS:2, partial [Entrophospora sp. SA101]